MVRARQNLMGLPNFIFDFQVATLIAHMEYNEQVPLLQASRSPFYPTTYPSFPSQVPASISLSSFPALHYPAYWRSLPFLTHPTRIILQKR